MKWKKKNPVIILIGGKARSGKSTVAGYLKEKYLSQNKKVVISPYTKYLKQYIEEITEKKMDEKNKPRELLQKISAELIKDHLGKEDFFINRQIEDIEIYSYFMDVIIIPDVRFPKEIEIIKKTFSNVISIGVIRKNYQSDLTDNEQKDITETALEHYHNYDYQIENIEENRLYQDTIKIFEDIEERRSI